LRNTEQFDFNVIGERVRNFQADSETVSAASKTTGTPGRPAHGSVQSIQSA